MRPSSIPLVALLITVSGCTLSPVNQAPEMGAPTEFKESGPWQMADPKDTQPRGEWWGVFKDSDLSALIDKVTVSNQTLASSAASAEQTAAVLKAARQAFLPTVGTSGSITESSNANSNRGGDNNSGAGKSRTIRGLSGNVSWEIDLWGRLRHGARAAKADAEAAVAEVEAIRLSVQAQAAETYFSLRAVDAKRALIASELESYERSLQLTRNRYDQGVASRADVAQAETQWATARVAHIELGVQRATLEHALAVLLGEAPAAFTLPNQGLTKTVPTLPSAAPATLLERRPDVAAAERRVAAANERIGSARAAFFPNLTLNADGGWRGLTQLISLPNRYWSLGPELAAPILDRGQRVAEKAQADAVWKQAVADYRQTVLTAFQEAEDALATLRILTEEAEAQAQGVRAARESERIAQNQYKEGTASFLNVTTAQAAALSAEQNALDLQARRLNATIALVRAMGGGW